MGLVFYLTKCFSFHVLPNGLRYLRLSRDGKAVQPEKYFREGE